MTPRPPSTGGPRPGGPMGGRKPGTAADTNASKKSEITKKVTRNCIVNAVVKNKQMIKARDERLGKAKKRKTRKEILAAMDLQELIVERAAMARMGFLDKAEELDVMIEAERARLKKERDEQDQLVLDQKMNGLRMSHTRRTAAMEAGQAARVTALEEKCALEIDELRANQKKEYDILISETATRATGGVSSCVCTDRYKCRHNKSASYNTRKPTKDVIRLRQNGQRLRTSGRLQEADEVDNMAAAIEARAERHWRKTVEESILSSAWCGGKSRLEQTVERQQATLRALIVTHTERMARLKQQYSLQQRNLQSTLAAERKKVIMYCRREAIKRRTKDIAQGAKEARNMNKHKSDGMQNVSKNLFKGSDDSDSGLDSDDDRLEGWKPPTACGVDNSKALSSYEDIASGNVHRKIAEGTFGAEEAGEDGLKTSGSRAMDAYRMKMTGATATFDPTRGGAQVKMGKFAAQPPPGSPPSVAPRGPGARAKVQVGKGKKKDNSSDDTDSDEEEEDDEEGEEDDEDEEDDDGSDDSEDNKATGKPTPPTHVAGPPRGPPSASPRGPSGPPRGPMGSPFPAGGFGGSPSGPPRGSPGPPRGPMASPFPAGGFGGPSRGPPSGPPRGPLASPFPTGGFGGPPHPESSPAGSTGPPRGPIASPFLAGGFGGPPQGLPSVSPGPPRGPMASPFPAGGLGGPPRGLPSVTPSPARGPMASPFPAGGFGGPPRPESSPAGSAGPPRGPLASPFPVGGFGGPPRGSLSAPLGPAMGATASPFPAGGLGGPSGGSTANPGASTVSPASQRSVSDKQGDGEEEDDSGEDEGEKESEGDDEEEDEEKEEDEDEDEEDGEEGGGGDEGPEHDDDNDDEDRGGDSRGSGAAATEEEQDDQEDEHGRDPTDEQDDDETEAGEDDEGSSSEKDNEPEPIIPPVEEERVATPSSRGSHATEETTQGNGGVLGAHESNENHDEASGSAGSVGGGSDGEDEQSTDKEGDGEKDEDEDEDEEDGEEGEEGGEGPENDDGNDVEDLGGDGGSSGAAATEEEQDDQEDEHGRDTANEEDEQGGDETEAGDDDEGSSSEQNNKPEPIIPPVEEERVATSSSRGSHATEETNQGNGGVLGTHESNENLGDAASGSAGSVGSGSDGDDGQSTDDAGSDTMASETGVAGQAEMGSGKASCDCRPPRGSLLAPPGPGTDAMASPFSAGGSGGPPGGSIANPGACVVGPGSQHSASDMQGGGEEERGSEEDKGKKESEEDDEEEDEEKGEDDDEDEDDGKEGEEAGKGSENDDENDDDDRGDDGNGSGAAATEEEQDDPEDEHERGTTNEENEQDDNETEASEDDEGSSSEQDNGPEPIAPPVEEDGVAASPSRGSHATEETNQGNGGVLRTHQSNKNNVDEASGSSGLVGGGSNGEDKQSIDDAGSDPTASETGVAGQAETGSGKASCDCGSPRGSLSAPPGPAMDSTASAFSAGGLGKPPGGSTPNPVASVIDQASQHSVTGKQGGAKEEGRSREEEGEMEVKDEEEGEGEEEGGKGPENDGDNDDQNRGGDGSGSVAAATDEEQDDPEGEHGRDTVNEEDEDDDETEAGENGEGSSSEQNNEPEPLVPPVEDERVAASSCHGSHATDETSQANGEGLETQQSNENHVDEASGSARSVNDGSDGKNRQTSTGDAGRDPMASQTDVARQSAMGKGKSSFDGGEGSEDFGEDDHSSRESIPSSTPSVAETKPVEGPEGVDGKSLPPDSARLTLNPSVVAGSNSDMCPAGETIAPDMVAGFEVDTRREENDSGSEQSETEGVDGYSTSLAAATRASGTTSVDKESGGARNEALSRSKPDGEDNVQDVESNASGSTAPEFLADVAVDGVSDTAPEANSGPCSAAESDGGGSTSDAAVGDETDARSGGSKSGNEQSEEWHTERCPTTPAATSVRATVLTLADDESGCDRDQAPSRGDLRGDGHVQETEFTATRSTGHELLVGVATAGVSDAVPASYSGPCSTTEPDGAKTTSDNMTGPDVKTEGDGSNGESEKDKERNPERCPTSLGAANVPATNAALMDEEPGSGTEHALLQSEQGGGGSTQDAACTASRSTEPPPSVDTANGGVLSQGLEPNSGPCSIAGGDTTVETMAGAKVETRGDESKGESKQVETEENELSPTSLDTAPVHVADVALIDEEPAAVGDQAQRNVVHAEDSVQDDNHATTGPIDPIDAANDRAVSEGASSQVRSSAACSDDADTVLEPVTSAEQGETENTERSLASLATASVRAITSNLVNNKSGDGGNQALPQSETDGEENVQGAESTASVPTGPELQVDAALMSIPAPVFSRAPDSTTKSDIGDTASDIPVRAETEARGNGSKGGSEQGEEENTEDYPANLATTIVCATDSAMIDEESGSGGVHAPSQSEPDGSDNIQDDMSAERGSTAPELLVGITTYGVSHAAPSANSGPRSTTESGGGDSASDAAVGNETNTRGDKFNDGGQQNEADDDECCSISLAPASAAGSTLPGEESGSVRDQKKSQSEPRGDDIVPDAESAASGSTVTFDTRADAKLETRGNGSKGGSEEGEGGNSDFCATNLTATIVRAADTALVDGESGVGGGQATPKNGVDDEDGDQDNEDADSGSKQSSPMIDAANNRVPIDVTSSQVRSQTASSDEANSVSEAIGSELNEAEYAECCHASQTVASAPLVDATIITEHAGGDGDQNLLQSQQYDDDKTKVAKHAVDESTNPTSRVEVTHEGVSTIGIETNSGPRSTAESDSGNAASDAVMGGETETRGDGSMDGSDQDERKDTDYFLANPGAVAASLVRVTCVSKESGGGREEGLSQSEQDGISAGVGVTERSLPVAAANGDAFGKEKEIDTALHSLGGTRSEDDSDSFNKPSDAQSRADSRVKEGGVDRTTQQSALENVGQANEVNKNPDYGDTETSEADRSQENEEGLLMEHALSASPMDTEEAEHGDRLSGQTKEEKGDGGYTEDHAAEGRNAPNTAIASAANCTQSDAQGKTIAQDFLETVHDVQNDGDDGHGMFDAPAATGSRPGIIESTGTTHHNEIVDDDRGVLTDKGTVAIPESGEDARESRPESGNLEDKSGDDRRVQIQGAIKTKSSVDAASGGEPGEIMELSTNTSSNSLKGASLNVETHVSSGTPRPAFESGEGSNGNTGAEDSRPLAQRCSGDEKDTMSKSGEGGRDIRDGVLESRHYLLSLAGRLHSDGGNYGDVPGVVIDRAPDAEGEILENNTQYAKAQGAQILTPGFNEFPVDSTRAVKGEVGQEKDIACSPESGKCGTNVEYLRRSRLSINENEEVQSEALFQENGASDDRTQEKGGENNGSDAAQLDMAILKTKPSNRGNDAPNTPNVGDGSIQYTGKPEPSETTRALDDKPKKGDEEVGRQLNQMRQSEGGLSKNHGAGGEIASGNTPDDRPSTCDSACQTSWISEAGTQTTNPQKDGSRQDEFREIRKESVYPALLRVGRPSSRESGCQTSWNNEAGTQTTRLQEQDSSPDECSETLENGKPAMSNPSPMEHAPQQGRTAASFALFDVNQLARQHVKHSEVSYKSIGGMRACAQSSV